MACHLEILKNLNDKHCKILHHEFSLADDSFKSLSILFSEAF